MFVTGTTLLRSACNAQRGRYILAFFRVSYYRCKPKGAGARLLYSPIWGSMSHSHCHQCGVLHWISWVFWSGWMGQPFTRQPFTLRLEAKIEGQCIMVAYAQKNLETSSTFFFPGSFKDGIIHCNIKHALRHTMPGVGLGWIVHNKLL